MVRSALFSACRLPVFGITPIRRGIKWRMDHEARYQICSTGGGYRDFDLVVRSSAWSRRANPLPFSGWVIPGPLSFGFKAVMDMDNPASAFYYTFFETQGTD